MKKSKSKMNKDFKKFTEEKLKHRKGGDAGATSTGMHPEDKGTGSVNSSSGSLYTNKLFR